MRPASFIFVLLFPHLLCSQGFEPDKNRKPLRDAYDTLRNSIRVPDIDPRQYAIIYEWKPANEDRKMKKGITGVDQANLLYWRIRRAQSVIDTLKVQARSIDDGIAKINTRIQENSLKIDAVAALINTALTAQQIFDKRVEAEKFTLASEKLKTTRDSLELVRSKKQTELEYWAKLVSGNNRKAEDLLQRPDSRETKPSNFYDCVGCDYPGLPKTYEEYYNYIVWRNAGTPSWEPIWWLNYYPWPYNDFRNIDLIDQDCREPDFALLPFQKYQVVDYKTKLRIVFDKQQLALNEDFKGSISIDATLFESRPSQGGKSDPRPVEVNPYSVIGEKKKTIGLLNRPAVEIAGHLIQLVILGNTLKSDNINLDQYEIDIRSRIDLMSNELNFIVKKLPANVDTLEHKTINGLESFLRKNCPFYNDESPGFSEFCQKIRSAIEARDASVLKDVSASFEKIKRDYQAKNAAAKRSYLNGYNIRIKQMELFVALCNSFEDGQGNTLDAFLSLMNINKVSFKHWLEFIKQNVEQVTETYRTYKDLGQDSECTQCDSFIGRLDERWKVVQTQLGYISNIQGSRINEVLKSLRYDHEMKKTLKDFDRFYNLGYKAGYSLGEVDRRRYPENFSFSLTNLPASPDDDYFSGFIDGYSDGAGIRGVDQTYNKISGLLNADYNYRDIITPYNRNSAIIEEYYNRELMDFRLISNNADDFKKLKEYIAEKAGEALYQDLIYATIDLDLADARPGDQLYIRMIWNKNPVSKSNDSNTPVATVPDDRKVSAVDEANRDGVALYMAIFDIENTGWSFAPTDVTALVKRINEDLLPVNYELVPNNFKLTGGAAAMWSFQNDYRVHKKIKTLKGTNLPRFNRRGELKYNKFWVGAERFAKWLEPSFGLNVTYLDFSRANPNFEVGIGPSIGFFNNLLHLHSGINLMETGQRPWYFSVGFSFVNLGTRFQEVTQPK